VSLAAALLAAPVGRSFAQGQDAPAPLGLYAATRSKLAPVDVSEPGFSVEVGAAFASGAGAVATPEAEPAKSQPTRPPSIRFEEGSRPTGETLQIPSYARKFLPDYMDKAAPDTLRALNSSTTQEMAQQLADYFKRFYPDVVYHVDWDDETVNAYAWMENGKRHVALLGGLLRHKAIGMEGIGLVLAHELGHHYGGPPLYSGSGLSCEGQADYWGASVGMRSAWGNQYRTQMLSAIDQLDKFFSKGLVSELTPEQELVRHKAEGECGHPPAACRKQTYQAAMAGLPKPACAGPTEPSGQLVREISRPVFETAFN
jgi:hypothetical protein